MSNKRSRRNWGSRAAFALGFAALAVLAFVRSVDAQQSLGGISPEQLLQQYQQRQGSGGGSVSQPDTPQNSVIQPVQPNNRVQLPPSRLEQIMSARAGARLQQFGYDQLGVGHSVTVPQTGAVQDDYVLGPGDEILVSLRGQENNEFRLFVDRNGRVGIPRLNPIPATGRSFSSFRQDVEASVRRAYVATSAFVSIGRVRQINVLVSGEVNMPGQRLLTGLSSAVDALLISGGVKKTGSLRNVRIQRGGREYAVDLYGVLTDRGAGLNLRLADGDRIVVPALGRTVAVSGLVRRPGIYELAPAQSSVSVRALLALAGGPEVRGQHRMSVLQILPDGRSNLAAVNDQTGLVRDSEILFLQMGSDQTASQATLSGGTGLAGAYPVTTGTKLSEVLRAPGAMGDAPYTLFGIIVRKDPRSLLRNLVAFTPVAVLSGSENGDLQPDDVIRVLSVREASLLSHVVRAYLEKLAVDQAASRNPLSDQTANVLPVMAAPPAMPVMPQTGAMAGAVPTATPQILSMLPVSKVDELSFALIDLIAAPPDVQRADIISLMDLRAPGSLGPGSTEAILEQQDQSIQRVDPLTSPPPYQAVPPAVAPGAPQSQMGSYGPYSPYGLYGASTTPYGMAGQGQSMSNGEQAQAINVPARNFQDTPLSPGTYVSNREIKTFGELVRQLDIDPLVLVNFLLEHRARLDGAVRGPGSYFVGPSVGLNDLVQAAGGTVDWADGSGVELITTAVDRALGRAETKRQTLPLRQSMLANYVVRPRDTLRFNQVFTDVGIGAVTVQGEVRFAGSYPITRGERLSELLARAGGLNKTAYPQGAVFLRRSAAAAEHDGYLRAASEIENQLVIAMTRVGNDKIDPSTFTSMQIFVNELRNQKAVGRISIVADPSVLAARPEEDPLLEAGDLLYVPQRPATVTVLGQVSQPGSFPYKAGRRLSDYVEMAGGYASTANEAMTFLVLPDGSARRIERSWLSFGDDDLPPGSTIVVPRDVTPLDTRQIILDVSQIFSQFAVSIASLAVLSKQ
jgi:protein involved in polysaccharide export with SLBB domain